MRAQNFNAMNQDSRISGPDSMEKWLPSRKIREKWQSDREVIAQNYGIFCQFRSKLANTHTIAIKWKENYDAVVVDCHHSLRLCGDSDRDTP